MAEGITTYAQGPDLMIMRDVTKAEFMSVCDQMGCRPEAITEGGFVYINAPGYKSMRILTYSGTKMVISKRTGLWKRLPHSRLERCDAWPRINPNTVSAEWRGNPEIILHGGQCIVTTLKAFNNAAPFTIPELEAWKAALADVGIVMGKLPPARSLRHSR